MNRAKTLASLTLPGFNFHPLLGFDPNSRGEVKECGWLNCFALITVSPRANLGSGAQMPDNLRNPNLDSTRGLAALVVCYAHSSVVFSVAGNNKYWWNNHLDAWTWPLSILRSLLNPEQAVIYFFVLSGFVLVQAVAGSPSLPAYWTRRFFRLYPPMVASVLIFWAVINTIRYNIDMTNNTPWMVGAFAKPISLNDVWENLLLLNSRANNPTWTIAAEFWGSLTLPLILFSFRRIHPLVVAILIGAVATLWLRLTGAMYLGCFALGAGLGSSKFRASKMPVRLLFTCCVAVSFCEARWPSAEGWKEFALALSGCGFLLVAIRGNGRLLGTKPLRFLGRISYSFYLLHSVALYVCAAIATSINLEGLGGIVFVLITSVAITVPMAFFLWKFVELPSISWGKKLALKLAANQPLGARSQLAEADIKVN
jgi:peptidoglycan/LPS O-acetylase OafA/YrhL